LYKSNFKISTSAKRYLLRENLNEVKRERGGRRRFIKLDIYI